MPYGCKVGIEKSLEKVLQYYHYQFLSYILSRNNALNVDKFIKMNNPYILKIITNVLYVVLYCAVFFLD